MAARWAAVGGRVHLLTDIIPLICVMLRLIRPPAPGGQRGARLDGALVSAEPESTLSKRRQLEAAGQTRLFPHPKTPVPYPIGGVFHPPARDALSARASIRVLRTGHIQEDAHVLFSDLMKGKLPIAGPPSEQTLIVRWR